MVYFAESPLQKTYGKKIERAEKFTTSKNFPDADVEYDLKHMVVHLQGFFGTSLTALASYLGAKYLGESTDIALAGGYIAGVYVYMKKIMKFRREEMSALEKL